MSLLTFADRVIQTNQQMDYPDDLPGNFKLLQPFKDNKEVVEITKEFYHKYYNDNNKRSFIIDINPSRNGGGVTGIPLTDTKHLAEFCAIDMKSAHSNELSSVFFYEMIQGFGGVDKFYSKFYVNAAFPLAIVEPSPSGNWVNASYYSQENLLTALQPYIVKWLKEQIALGINTSEVFVLGKENYEVLEKINKENSLFKTMTALEHPRYIQQYKSAQEKLYIDKYILTLSGHKS
ncbi:uracil-DNA glycosylase family protein [Myroides sp. LJL115]